MRIVFFGSGEFGVPTLAALCREHEVGLVVSQVDRPAGRRRRLTATPIVRWAMEQEVPLIRPGKLNTPEVLDRVRAAEPEASVVVAFGRKVGNELIAAPSLGPGATVNLHASLLPKYRGAAPIQWAIIRGERETGNTVFSLVEKMDAGDILGQQRTEIDPRDTAGELHDRLAEMGPALVLDVLERLGAGTARPVPQDESGATLAPKLSRADGTVDFAEPADAVRCRVHGLTPWPGARCSYVVPFDASEHPLILRRVESIPEADTDAPPGRMIDDGLIATGRGAVRLLEVQPPGKRAMSWDDFTRGHPVPIDTRFHATPDQSG